MKQNKILLWSLAAVVGLPAFSAMVGGLEKSNGRNASLRLAGEKNLFDTSATPNVFSTDAPELVKVASPVKTPAKAPEGAIWFEGFETEEQFNQFKVVNANNDKYQWEYVTFYQEPRVSTSDDLKTDDWLISPAIELEGGKSYRFTMEARPGSANYDMDKFEVKAGMGNEPSDLTIEVLPVSETQFIGYDGIPPKRTTYTGYLKTTEAGNYYIAVHAVSDPGAYTFYVRNLTLYAGVEAAAPGEVTDLTATPEKDGNLSVDISFRTPKIDAKDQDLTSLTKVEVLRGDVLVHTFENPEVDTMLTFTDTPESIGTYTYTVIPYNDEGAGMAQEVEVFVGVGYASAPEEASVVETENDGEVTISWTPVTTAEDGGYINAEKVRYFIGVILPTGELETVTDDVEGTSYTYQAVEEGEQVLLQYAVASKTDQGYSEATISNPLTAGTPAAVPWYESFPNASLNTVMGTQALIGNCQWSISRDESFQNMQSADDDNGYVSFWTTAPGDQGRLYTGKFLLADMSNPAVTFYIYKHTSGTPDLGTIEVELDEGNGFETIKTVVAENYPLKGWNKVVVPIPDSYKGKVIRLGFKATRVTYTYQFLDQLQLEDLTQHNLMVTGISGPDEILPGEEFRIEGHVTNTGALDAEGYKLVLKSNGNTIAEKFGQSIPTGNQLKVSFKVKENVVAGLMPVYTLAVEWNQDEIESDNAKDLVVKQRINDYPIPADITGTGSPESITIEWAAPAFDPAAVPADVYEDFEDYDSFANKHVGEWIFYDGDQGKIGGFHRQDGTEIKMGDINMNTQQSWWVMDAAAESLSDIQTLGAKSGNKYLAQQYVVGGVVCDDWAISPELYPGGQTISFYARSFYASEPETFEVLYSTGSTEPADFIKLISVDNTPGVWTQYSVALPEGACRFAIRCTSDYKAMMFVDDIIYIPAGNYGLELEGYNVYRDGKLITSKPVNEPMYVDTDVTEGKIYTYHISSIYNKGESKAAGPAMFVASGVNSVLGTDGEIYVEGKTICIDNQGGKRVSVYSASGMTVCDIQASDKERIPVASGLYLIQIGNKACKVIVK